jgi:hypothetical protein
VSEQAHCWRRPGLESLRRSCTDLIGKGRLDALDDDVPGPFCSQLASEQKRRDEHELDGHRRGEHGHRDRLTEQRRSQRRQDRGGRDGDLPLQCPDELARAREWMLASERGGCWIDPAAVSVEQIASIGFAAGCLSSLPPAGC